MMEIIGFIATMMTGILTTFEGAEAFLATRESSGKYAWVHLAIVIVGIAMTHQPASLIIS